MYLATNNMRDKLTGLGESRNSDLHVSTAAIHNIGRLDSTVRGSEQTVPDTNLSYLRYCSRGGTVCDCFTMLFFHNISHNN